MSGTKRQYREIDVKKQHSMSFRETFMLCVRGVSHRMLRSVLTLAVVVLAVAFFMFLLAESMFIRSIGLGVEAEAEHQRASQQLMNRMFSTATDYVTVRRLAEARKREDKGVFDEFSRLSGMEQNELNHLSWLASEEILYTKWLNEIPTGNRTVLIHKTSGRAAFEHILADVNAFTRKLEPMLDIRAPAGLDRFREFLDDYKSYEEAVRKLTLKWNEKVNQANMVMAEAKGDDSLDDNTWIMKADPEKLETWRADLEALGFSFSKENLELMLKQLTEVAESELVFAHLNTKEVREAWTREFRESNPSTAEQKALRLKDKRAIKILSDKFAPSVLERVSDKTVYDNRLSKLERKLAPSLAEGSTVLGLGMRQFFLLTISFVVCMVGITNAMLMSITERFREIATMKCLGATDTYILVQFMMEAGMQGFLGGIFGVITGFFIASARSGLNFGAYLFNYWPGGDIIISASVSLFAGVLLAILASIIPSWIASRMAPMDAMRVE
jgi:hypothetical protein